MRWLAGLLIAILLSSGVYAQSAEPELLLTLGRGEIVSAAWSPDGESIWIGTTAGTWQLDAHLQEIAAYPHITYAALSPDGAHLAGTSPDGYVAVWDIATGEEVERWSASYLSPGAPDVPIWSPDSGRFILNMTGWHSYASPMLSGGLFVLGERSNSPRPTGYGPAQYAVWSTSGAYGAIYDPELDRIFVFTPNGDGVSLEGSDGIGDLSTTGETTYLRWRGDTELTYATIGDGSVRRRWSIPDGQSLEDVPRSNCWGYSGCTYSADGRYAALGLGTNFILSVIDLDAQEMLWEYETDKGQPTDPVWRPDGERVAAFIRTLPTSNMMKGIIVIERTTGRIVWERNEAKILPVELLWSPDGTRIFTYDAGGRMALIDGETGDVSARSDVLYNAALVSFDPGDTLLAVADSGGNIRVIDSASGEIIDRWLRSGPRIAQMIWHPNSDSHRLAVRDGQQYTGTGEVTLWDAITQDKKAIIPYTQFNGRYYAGARGIAWKPDGSALAIGLALGMDNSLWIHDAQDIELPLPERIARRGSYASPIQALAWMPGADLPLVVLTGGLFDSNSGDVIPKIGDGWRATADGRLLTIQAMTNYQDMPHPGPLMLVIDEATGIPLRESDAYITERAWVSPLGRFAAAIDADGAGLVWDDTGAPLQFLSHIADLIWTSDDSTLAILQRNGSVWLQGAYGLRLLWSPPLPVKSSGTLVWSNDGSTLAHVQDGVLRVWKP